MTCIFFKLSPPAATRDFKIIIFIEAYAKILQYLLTVYSSTVGISISISVAFLTTLDQPPNLWTDKYHPGNLILMIWILMNDYRYSIIWLVVSLGRQDDTKYFVSTHHETARKTSSVLSFWWWAQRNQKVSFHKAKIFNFMKHELAKTRGFTRDTMEQSSRNMGPGKTSVWCKRV